jgi:hypothetical protein
VIVIVRLGARSKMMTIITFIMSFKPWKIRRFALLSKWSLRGRLIECILRTPFRRPGILFRVFRKVLSLHKERVIRLRTFMSMISIKSILKKSRILF